MDQGSTNRQRDYIYVYSYEDNLLEAVYSTVEVGLVALFSSWFLCVRCLVKCEGYQYPVISVTCSDILPRGPQ